MSKIKEKLGLVGLLLMTMAGIMTPERGEITASDRAEHPGMKAWEIDYTKPEGDPGNRAAMGEVKNAASWIQLGILPQL